MDMQDKDFDQLLSRKFEGFEEEPSPMIWENISENLSGRKPRRPSLGWVSIAASVLIAVAAGALFLKTDNGVTKRRPTQTLVKRVKHLPTVSEKQEIESLTTKTGGVRGKAIATAHGAHHTKFASAKSLIIPVRVTPADILDHEPMINDQPVIAAIADPASAKLQVTLPDVQLGNKLLNTDMQGEKGVTASTDGRDSKPEGKRGIHSFGGLINAVIAKIDKRDDKVVEFSDGDEDDDNSTTLTGINLGLIKIKKQ